MKNILVIEDSKFINNVIKEEFVKCGFEVEQAFTFATAREFLDTKEFQLIILDLHLPDGEGAELVSYLRSLTETKVVVLTASDDVEIREELFKWGILDYIIKDKQLIDSIAEVMQVVATVTTKQKEKILIIDDSKLVHAQIKTILEPRNYLLTSALDAKEGLDALQQEEFELIILDMELPDMHGIKVLEEIRKTMRINKVPIIVLSGTSTPEIIRNVLKNGANDFLKKPFIFEEFILKIDLWIDYFKKEKELEEKTFKLQFMNDNLEKLVYDEVEKNRKKDKLMFAQSRHAQMGEMIAMIAHQWRQPLNAISMAINVMSMKVQQGTFDEKTAQEIQTKTQKYIKHLSATIDDFREFFKPQKAKRVTDFEIICNKALSLMQSSLEQKNIDLEIKVIELRKFLSFENELVQVILNILKNAEDILVEKEIPQPKITIEINQYTLKISDNAGGVPENIIENIFDPYFSTKEQKNGTGLGLYMSKIIIEEHCFGSIHINNTQEGACFTISLPNNSKDTQ